MPKTNRPPLAAAREHATKQLIKAHQDEWDGLVDEYLNRQGWEYQEVTRHRWVNQGAAAPEGK